MIRVAPRKIDSDNLQFSMKSIRDTIADILIPGKNRGMADSDERITWQYDQRKGDPKEYALEIQVNQNDN